VTSDTLHGAINSPETAEVFAILLSITDPNEIASGLPLYVSSDNADEFPLISETARGILFDEQEYIWFPFDLTLPNISESSIPRAQLSISGVDRTIIEAVRTIQNPLDINIKIIATSQRAVEGYTPERELNGLSLSNVSHSATRVSGNLEFEILLTEPWPWRTFNPVDFPGIF